MNYKSIGLIFSYFFLLTSSSLIVAVTSLDKVLSLPLSQQVQQSMPRLEFCRQKPGTEAQFMAEYQNLRRLENEADREKTNRAIANFFESVNLDNTYILEVIAQPTSIENNWEVLINFNEEGAKKFAQLTKELAGTGRSIGIFVDGKLISAPVVSIEFADTGITGGQAVISGNFTQQQAQDLATRLNNQTHLLK
jgi:preprotein translocase subunit SecD